MKKNIFIFAVATLLMASCEKGGESVVANPDEIRFETSISRVAGATFEEGDTFGLYAVEYNGEEVADRKGIYSSVSSHANPNISP